MIIKDQQKSLFMGNYFCLIEKYQVAFVAISKNAVTSLKNIAIYYKTGKVPVEELLTHQVVGYSEQSPYLYTPEKLRHYEAQYGQVMKFAVWRDPVERLLSCYKFFCLEQHERLYFRYLDLFHDHSFGRFMQFVEFELGKSNPLYQDEHIRKQADYYKSEDVDYIVPIEKLDLFLKEHHIEFIPEKSNHTQVCFDFPREKWEKKIKELYAADYEIIPNYS